MRDKAKEALYDAKRGSYRKRATVDNPAHGNSKLIPVRKTVRKKNGMTYQQTFWVTPEEAKEQGLGVDAGREGSGGWEGGGGLYAGAYGISGGMGGADYGATNFLTRIMEAARKDEPERYGKYRETSVKRNISSVSREDYALAAGLVEKAWERSPFFKVKGVYRVGNPSEGERGFWGGTACDLIDLLGRGGLENPMWLTGSSDDACGMCAVGDHWEHGDLYQCGLASIRCIVILRGEYGTPWTARDFARNNGRVPGNLSRLVDGKVWTCFAEPEFIVELE